MQTRVAALTRCCTSTQSRAYSSKPVSITAVGRPLPSQSRYSFYPPRSMKRPGGPDGVAATVAVAVAAAARKSELVQMTRQRITSNLGSLGRLGGNRVGEDANAADLNLNIVAGLHPERWFTMPADTAGRARRDNVSGQEFRYFRDVGD